MALKPRMRGCLQLDWSHSLISNANWNASLRDYRVSVTLGYLRSSQAGRPLLTAHSPPLLGSSASAGRREKRMSTETRKPRPDASGVVFWLHEIWRRSASTEPEVVDRIGACPALIPLKTSSWSKSQIQLQLWGVWGKLGIFSANSFMLKSVLRLI